MGERAARARKLMISCRGRLFKFVARNKAAHSSWPWHSSDGRFSFEVIQSFGSRNPIATFFTGFTKFNATWINVYYTLQYELRWHNILYYFLKPIWSHYCQGNLFLPDVCDGSYLSWLPRGNGKCVILFLIQSLTIGHFLIRTLSVPVSYKKKANKRINKQMCTQLRIIAITSSTNVLQNT